MAESLVDDQKPELMIDHISYWANALNSSVMIISKDGSVLFSNSSCKNEFGIQPGDFTILNQYKGKVVGIKKTPDPFHENLWISVSSFFDVNYESKIAHLVILQTSPQEIQEDHSIQQSMIESLLGIFPGVVYRCENDIDRMMSYLSEGCFELTGYASESFTSKKGIVYSGLIHPEDFLRSWEEIQTALSENRTYTLTYRIRHASGNYRWVQEQGKGIFDPEGKIYALEGWIIDISDRKKLEQALGENESYYQNLIEASPDAVILVNHKGIILFSNRQLVEMLNFVNQSAVVGKNIIDFFPYRENQISEHNIMQILKERDPHHGCYQIQARDGRIFPCEINVRIIPGTNGQREKYMLVVHDVSAHEKIVQALENSEARYRAIVEDNPEMIVRFAPDGTISFANQTFCSFFESDPDQLRGKNIINVVPKYLHKDFLYLINSLSPKMVPGSMEHKIQRNESEEQWLRWKTQPIRNVEGQFIEYQSIGENITVEKKIEKNNLQSELFLRNIMESIKLIAIILDPQGKLTFCNSHFLEMTGWEKENVIGKDWLENFVPRDSATLLNKFIIESSVNGIIPQRYENALLTRTGEQRLISWNNTLLKDEHGITTGIASIGEDITDKHYSEITREVIYQIAQSTISANDLNDLFHSIHVTLMDLMPADNFFIALYDEETDLLSFPYFIDQFDTPPSPHKPNRSLTSYILRSGKPLLADPEVFTRLVETNEVEPVGTPSLDWMGVPLIVDNKVFGVMAIQSYSEGIRYSKHDEQMFTFVSTQIAMAIERKRSEQALKTSMRRNKLLVEASSDAILLETLQGNILDCNQIAESMYGYSKEELVSMSVRELVNEDFITDKPDYLQWQLDHGGHFSNILNIRKDGSLFPVEVNTMITDVEDDTYVVSYVRDITEHKIAENAILESETKFRALAQTTAAGIFIHLQDKFLYINPMWSEITGYTEEELLQISLWDVITNDSVTDAKCKIQKLTQENIEMVRFETTIFSKEGIKKWLDVTCGFIEYQGEKAVIGTAIDITHRKQREHELEIVALISDSLRSTVVIDEIRTTILKELIEQLDIDGAILSTIEPENESYNFIQAIGCWLPLDKKSVEIQEGLTGFIISSGKFYVNHNAPEDPYFKYLEYVQNLTSIAGMPLITQGKTVGSLLIGASHMLTENELRLLKTIGGLSAAAIHRSDLYSQISLQTQELKQAYDVTLEGWAHALELRDKETQGHSVRIANLTIKLAKRMGYKEDELDNIRRGALLHDIGKMGVPDTILLKPGKLTEDEWLIMQKHPTYAFEMLSDLPYFKETLDIPYCHHEWWDGTGYPRGLKGTEIPLVARIFAIVDAWDALVSDRPYRKAWRKSTALTHIVDQAGTHFDQEVVDNFVQMINEEEDE